MLKCKDQLYVYHSFYEDIIEKMVHKKYSYIDTSSYLNLIFEKDGVKKQNEIYWKEILLRAHYASTISLLRNDKWLKGIIISIEESNYILFSSSLRGFLESVTDSYYSLLNAPSDLATNFYNIKLAIKGRLDGLFLSQRLEESLIHFQFAKKVRKSDLTFDYLDAKYTMEYINFFDEYSNDKVKDLYKLLCEVVHPASSSVEYFTKNVKKDESSEYTTTDLTLDDSKIIEVLYKYRAEIEQLLKMSISVPFICLKILRLFDLDNVKSSYIDTCKYNNYIEETIWREFLEMIEKSG